MRTLETTQGRTATGKRPTTGILPPARACSALPRTFRVRCTSCGHTFEVDRAPAACPACGGISVAG